MCRDLASKINSITNQLSALNNVDDDHKGDIDTNAVLAMIKKLQFELQQKADSKDIDHLKVLLDGKADKKDIIREMDRMDKNINDLKRLVLSLEEKVKLIERELQQCS